MSWLSLYNTTYATYTFAIERKLCSNGRAAEAERQHKIESRLPGSIISCEFETAGFNFNSKEDMRTTGKLEYVRYRL